MPTVGIGRRAVALLLVAGLALAGCSSGPAAEREADPSAPAPVPVGLLTELAPADVPAVAGAVNGFGFDLFAELANGEENTVTSPLSAAALLAMILAGAGGDTAAAMAAALHLDNPRDVRVGALLDAVADTDDVTLSVANALWADEEIPFEEDYIGFVRQRFGAGLETADLASQATADDIDQWVNDQTEGRIEQIAADLGLPDPEAALVLLNAVYFLGQWTTEFDPAETMDSSFTLADGATVQVPMMHLRGQEFGYAQRDGYRMLRLPYGEQGRYGMELLLPDPGTGLPQLIDRLDAAEWQAAVAGLAPQSVDEVALPRFTVEWGENLNDTLDVLGMGPAFAPGQADFTPMSPADLYLDQVVQKTFITVDEQGTEAAAVTGGAVGITSLQPGLVFRVDSPFIFTISDSHTGAILFLGAVTDPRG